MHESKHKNLATTSTTLSKLLIKFYDIGPWLRRNYSRNFFRNCAAKILQCSCSWNPESTFPSWEHNSKDEKLSSLADTKRSNRWRHQAASRCPPIWKIGQVIVTHNCGQLSDTIATTSGKMPSIVNVAQKVDNLLLNSVVYSLNLVCVSIIEVLLDDAELYSWVMYH